MNNVLKVGMVVSSAKGRDAGKCFVITSIVDAEYVYIANGTSRMMSKPKLKKTKHLKPNGDILAKIAEKLLENKQVFDSEIKSALRAYNQKD